MQSYRTRALSIARHALLGWQQQQQQAQRGQRTAAGVMTAARWLRARFVTHVEPVHVEIVAGQLAPAVAMERAVAQVPPVPPTAPAAEAVTSTRPAEAAGPQGNSSRPVTSSSSAASTTTTIIPAAESSNTAMASGSSSSSPATTSSSPAASNSINTGAVSSAAWRWKWRPRGKAARRASAATAAAAAVATGTSATKRWAPAGAPAAVEAPLGFQGGGAATTQLPAVLPLRVAVYGAGLESCTAATLRLPSGQGLEAARFDNRAGQQLLAALRAQHAKHGVEVEGGRSGLAVHVLPAPQPGVCEKGWPAGSGGSGTGSGTVIGATTRGGGSSSSSAGKGAGAAWPGLLLQFALPLATLLQLPAQQAQQVQQRSSSPAGQEPSPSPSLTLELATDFGSLQVPTQLSTQVRF